MAKQELQIGDTGGQLVSKLKNNFDELYLGSGGIGYIIQSSDDIDDNSWWVTKALTYSSFLILNDHDFGGNTVTLPSGLTLLFNGGVWSNGTVIGNSSIFSVYGLQQAFDVDLTFSGTWIVEGICPQYFGAVTNPNTTTFSNDCHSEIQACLDSPFNVFMPAGFYYISSGLIPTIPKTVVCKRGNVDGYTEGAVTVADHTRIYTDQDIALIIIRTSNFNILDFPVLDTKAVSDHTLNTINYDLDYSIVGGRIDTYIIGNDSALATAGKGTVAVSFDDSATTTEGYAYFLKLNLFVYAVRKAVYVSSLRITRVLTVTIALHEWDIYVDGAKQSFDVNTGTGYKVSGDHQSQPVLPIAETDIPAIYWAAGQSIFDILMTDYGLAATRNHHWFQNYGQENEFINKGKWLDSYGYVEYFGTSVFRSIERSPQPHYRTGGESGNQGLIYNELAYLPTSVGWSITAYDGTGYNYDTNLGESVGQPATDHITITNASELFKIRGIGTRIEFTDLAGKDNEFVEIVIPLSGYLNIRNLYYYIGERPAIFNRIQTIIIGTGTEVDNIYPPNDDVRPNRILYYPFINGGVTSKSGGVTKLIIRFIGCTAINSAISIESIFMAAYSLTNGPFIDKQGGQTIYGTLGVNDGVKETNLPVYADNAAAKAGGLVAGDPYRTSTGIRMVVYD